MSAPLFRIRDLVKGFGGATPLRIQSLDITAHDRIVLSGLSAEAAEMFVHVLTGAALPDEGTVEVFGQSTRDIKTDTEWLHSLDRIGLVSNRAVLLDQSTIAQNLALPLTLSIDPMEDSVRQQVEEMAASVGIARTRLDELAGSMSADERMRAHLARAVALKPEVVFLEEPTSSLTNNGAAFGAALKSASDARSFAWLAISSDEGFARASGGKALRANPQTGVLQPAGGFWRRFFT